MAKLESKSGRAEFLILKSKKVAKKLKLMAFF
jgi:hypothetical protein